MATVQTEYRDRMSNPEKKSVWIVVDDIPGDDDEALVSVLKAAVRDTVGRYVNHNRKPEPRCDVSAGIAKLGKLRIFVQEK